MQKKPKKSMFYWFRRMYAENGVRGLYTGLTPRVAKIAPACAIMVSTFEYGKNFFEVYNMNRYKRQHEADVLGRNQHSCEVMFNTRTERTHIQPSAMHAKLTLKSFVSSDIAARFPCKTLLAGKGTAWIRAPCTGQFKMFYAVE
ncbi:hypothetical protein J6590_062570 [Homalodisca vitripennis]|nr:hypothetical protein J6590_062570 [Homalodisca vitripennis]